MENPAGTELRALLPFLENTSTIRPISPYRPVFVYRSLRSKSPLKPIDFYQCRTFCKELRFVPFSGKIITLVDQFPAWKLVSVSCRRDLNEQFVLFFSRKEPKALALRGLNEQSICSFPEKNQKRWLCEA
jgi:hypothetical protein